MEMEWEHLAKQNKDNQGQGGRSSIWQAHSTGDQLGSEGQTRHHSLFMAHGQLQGQNQGGAGLWENIGGGI